MAKKLKLVVEIGDAQWIGGIDGMPDVAEQVTRDLKSGKVAGDVRGTDGKPSGEWYLTIERI